MSFPRKSSKTAFGGVSGGEFNNCFFHIVRKETIQLDIVGRFPPSQELAHKFYAT